MEFESDLKKTFFILRMFKKDESKSNLLAIF